MHSIEKSCFPGNTTTMAFFKIMIGQPKLKITVLSLSLSLSPMFITVTLLMMYIIKGDLKGCWFFACGEQLTTIFFWGFHILLILSSNLAPIADTKADKENIS